MRLPAFSSSKFNGVRCVDMKVTVKPLPLESASQFTCPQAATLPLLPKMDGRVEG